MAGWTTPPTAVGGVPYTVAQLNAIRDDLNALNGFVRKTADESVTSSATLQNDDHLLYTIGATGTYVFDLHLYVTSAANAAGDLAVAFSFPTGTCHWAAMGPTPSIASGHVDQTEWISVLSATSGVSTTSYGLTTSNMYIQMHGILIATATGTLQFMWAQQASNANASTIKSGSHMVVRQVA